jgi:hypothetical protein
MEEHMHIQLVLEATSRSADSAHFTWRFKKYILKWVHNASPPNHKVVTRKLTGTGAHTWLGMLGYVTKDILKAYFLMAKSDNVTDEVRSKLSTLFV